MVSFLITAPSATYELRISEIAPKENPALEHIYIHLKIFLFIKNMLKQNCKKILCTYKVLLLLNKVIINMYKKAYFILNCKIKQNKFLFQMKLFN